MESRPPVPLWTPLNATHSENALRTQGSRSEQGRTYLCRELQFALLWSSMDCTSLECCESHSLGLGVPPPPPPASNSAAISYLGLLAFHSLGCVAIRLHQVHLRRPICAMHRTRDEPWSNSKVFTERPAMGASRGWCLETEGGCRLSAMAWPTDVSCYFLFY